MAYGLDDLLGAIFTGGQYTKDKKMALERQKQMDIVNKLQATQALNIPQGSSIQEMGRGMDLQNQGVRPQTAGPQIPQYMQPNAGMGQNVPQMPQGSVFPQMGVGGQGPTQLPLNRSQNAQDTQALNHFDLWQQQNQQGQALGSQAKQAQIGDVLSQTNLRNAQAGYYQNRLQAGGQGSQQLAPDHMAALRFGVETGILAPSELTFRGPKTQILAEGIMQRPDFQQWYSKQQPGTTDPLAQGFNPMAADTKLSGMKSEATGVGSARGRQTQQTGAAVGGMERTLDLVRNSINNVPNNKLKVVTGALRQGLSQVNDPDVAEFMGYMVSLRGMYASMLKNGGTPDLQTEAESARVISDKIDQGGFKGLEKFLRNEGRARMAGIKQGPQTGNNASVRQPHPQDSQAVQWAKSNPKDPRAKKILQLNGQ